jgi:two-component system, sensor histidine kinase PdtaS
MLSGQNNSFRVEEGAELRARLKILDHENGQLREALENKSVELRECNHRIANSLTIAAALMRQQLRALQDNTSKDILKTAASRIEAIGRFHRHLTAVESTSKVDFSTFLAAATAEMAAANSLHCAVHSVPGLAVDSNIAMKLALVLNELFINAKKHAYADRDAGLLEVTCFAGDDGSLHLEVTDQGSGFPNGFDLDGAKGLGLSVMRSIIQQLRGVVVTDSGPGARFKITVPIASNEIPRLP